MGQGFKIQYNGLKKRLNRYCSLYSFFSMRKTGNLLIRETTRKSIRETLPALNSTTSIGVKNELKENSNGQIKIKQQKRNSQLKNYHESQKELTNAENLNEQQQMQIHNEARKTVAKKVKASQSNIENEMITMLEQQCTKLGSDLQKEKITNEKLKSQIQILRQNIQSLNLKLEKVYEDHQSLSKHQQDGRVEVKQLLQELSRVKQTAKMNQEEMRALINRKEEEIKKMDSEIKSLTDKVQCLGNQNFKIKEQKQEIEEELQQKTNQALHLREAFQNKKLEWEASQKEMENQTRLNLQKKGQKITKFQSDYLKLQEKLKEEQTVRKKVIEKNKELQRQVNHIGESKKELEETIVSLKKRVNDLSILKSTNSSILNQKINQLMEENNNLKLQISELQGVKIPSVENEKPILFGSDDYE